MTWFEPIQPDNRFEGRRVTEEFLDEIAAWTGGKRELTWVSGIPVSSGYGLVHLTAHIGEWVFKRSDGIFYVRDQKWVDDNLMEVDPE